MTKRRSIMLIALALALLMPVITVFTTMASAETPEFNSAKYVSPDINSLMGAGEEPEDLSVTSGATYQEKAWYEYVMYSDHAVSSYRIDDDTRILFYDPYTYTNSMIMDVQFDATTTQFDTMSSYSISKTSSRTIMAQEESTYTTSSAVQTSGKDEFGTSVQNSGSTHTKYNYDEIHKTDGTVIDTTNYGYSAYDTVSLTVAETLELQTVTGTTGVEIEVGSKTTVQDTFGMQWLQDEVTHETKYKNYKSTVTHDYEYDVADNTHSETTGWEQLSARVTKTIGSSATTTTGWSETESTTITKTYAATHFSSDGVTPLPWAIVHYQVQMPMKCCLQVKYSGEWVTISTVYCLLTTVQGTCRAWMQNGQVYYEDWGSGEPVVATDFWSQFMTREQLINAYADKLYPVGGED